MNGRQPGNTLRQLNFATAKASGEVNKIVVHRRTLGIDATRSSEGPRFPSIQPERFALRVIHQPRRRVRPSALGLMAQTVLVRTGSELPGGLNCDSNRIGPRLGIARIHLTKAEATGAVLSRLSRTADRGEVAAFCGGRPSGKIRLRHHATRCEHWSVSSRSTDMRKRR